MPGVAAVAATRRGSARALRIAGVLLAILGLVHLAATPHIPHLLDKMASPEAYAFAWGPTVLNHVLVGVLLLPLGYTTWLAAAPAHVEQAWVKKLLRANSAASLALPLSIVLFMRESSYYESPLFLAGVILAFALSAFILVSAFVATRTTAP